jgi:hypothetical protein
VNVFIRNTSALPSIGARTLNMDGCIGVLVWNFQRAGTAAPPLESATDVPKGDETVERVANVRGGARARKRLHRFDRTLYD